jgi:tol-pal system protein YbgF
MMYLSDQIKALNDQMARMNERVNALQASQDALEKKAAASMGSDLVALRKEVKQDLLDTKAAMRELSAKVEDNRTLVKRAVERDTKGEDAVKEGLTDLANRVAKLEAKQAELEARGVTAVTPAKKTSSPAPKETQPAAKPVEGIDTAEKKAYDAAYSLYSRKMYKEAIAAFQSFIQKHPSSSLCENAYFWSGESHFALKEYEKAILAYQDVIKKYPNGSKVPNAMLRQALAFTEIKDPVSAKVLLRRLIEKYPDSSEASIAKGKLQTIR